MADLANMTYKTNFSITLPLNPKDPTNPLQITTKEKQPKTPIMNCNPEKASFEPLNEWRIIKKIYVKIYQFIFITQLIL
jgi:hypothetical protein